MLTAKGVAFIVVVAVLGSGNEAQTDVTSSENGIADTTACATEFLEWCRNRSDGSYGHNNGVSLLSEGMFEKNQTFRVFCVSDSIGVNCTRNNSPWFLCLRNGSLEYKGEELTPGLEDDDLCNTKDRARKMFGPHIMTFNHTAFEHGMKVFRERLDQRMREFYKTFRHPMLPGFRRNKDP